jgi:hypothetical protein
MVLVSRIVVVGKIVLVNVPVTTWPKADVVNVKVVVTGQFTCAGASAGVCPGRRTIIATSMTQAATRALVMMSLLKSALPRVQFDVPYNADRCLG